MYKFSVLLHIKLLFLKTIHIDDKSTVISSYTFQVHILSLYGLSMSQLFLGLIFQI